MAELEVDGVVADEEGGVAMLAWTVLAITPTSCSLSLGEWQTKLS